MALPRIDEHMLTIEAGREATWRALVRMVETIAPGGFAQILGCTDTAASGPRPLAAGSTVPGFHVVIADDPNELSLAGRHHFSDYALTFRLDEVGVGETRIRAETRAAFPGVTGTIYRTFLMGTGAHVVATRRMLATVKRGAESQVWSHARRDS